MLRAHVRVILIALFLGGAILAHANSYVFNNAGSANWTAPASWTPPSPAGGPVNTDDVTIQAGNCVVDSGNQQCKSLTVTGGSLDASGSRLLSVFGSANLSGLTGYVASFPTNNLTLVMRNGGAALLTAPTTTTVHLIGLTINSSPSTVALSGTLSLNGALTMSSGTFSLYNGGTAATLTLSASSVTWSAAATLDIGIGTLDGATNAANVTVGANSTVTQTTGTLKCANFTLTTGGTYAFGAAGALNCSGNLSMLAGAFTPSASTVTMSGGALATPATINMGGGNQLNILSITGSAYVSQASAVTMSSLDIGSSANYSLAGFSDTINGTLLIQGTGFGFAHVEGTGVLTTYGTESITGTGFNFVKTSGTVRYFLQNSPMGAAPLGLTYWNVELDNTGSSTWTAAGNLVASNTLCIHSGTLAMSANSLTAAAIQIDGGYNAGYYWGGILQGGAGSITINGTTTFINDYKKDGQPTDGGNGLPGGYPALTAGAGALTFNGNVTGAGLLTASSTTTTFAGSLTLYDPAVYADLGAAAAAGTFTANGGTALAIFNGTGTQTEYVNGSSFSRLTVSNGTTLQVVNSSWGGANALNVGTLTISTTTDMVDVAGQNFTITTLAGLGILALNNAQATKTVTGGVNTGGTIRYEGGSGGTILWTAFSNLEINASAGTIFTTSGNTTTANNCNVVLTSGSLRPADTFNLTIGASGAPGNLIFQGANAVLDMSLLTSSNPTIDVWGNIGGPGLNAISGSGTITATNVGRMRVRGGYVNLTGITVNNTGGSLNWAFCNTSATTQFTSGGKTIASIRIGTPAAAGGQVQLQDSLTLVGNDGGKAIYCTTTNPAQSIDLNGKLLKVLGGSVDTTNLTAFLGTTSTLEFAGTSSLNTTCTSGTPPTFPVGTITIDSATGALTLASNVTVDGNWTNNRGAAGLTASGFGVTLDTSAAITVIGANHFASLTVPSTAAGKIIQFDSTAFQTVTGTFTVTGASGSLISLVSNSSPTQWSISVATNGGVTWASVKDSAASGAATIPSGLAATTSSNQGDNTGWNFGGAVAFTWTGAVSTDWNGAGNWNQGYVPNPTDNVTVPLPGNLRTPVLSGSVAVANLAIQNGAIVDLVGFALTVTGNLDMNTSAGGTLRLQGGQTVTIGTKLFTGGTVEYYGTVGYTGLATGITGVTYGYLKFTGASTWILNANTLTVASDLTIGATSTLDASSIGNYAIAVGGNWINNGVFVPRTGNVTFNGAGAQGLTDTTTTFSTVTLNKSGGTFTANNALYTATLTAQAGTGAYNVSLSGGMVSGAASTTFANTGSLTIGLPGFTFTGGVTATAPSSTTLSGALVSAGGAVSLGPLTLGADASIDTSNAGASPAGASIGITTITGNAHNLTLLSRNGTTTVSGAASGLAAVTLQDNTAQSTGAVSFTTGLAAASLSTFAQPYALSIAGASITSAGVTSILNTNGFTLSGTSSFSGGLSSISAGTNTLSGTVSSGGAATQNISLSNLSIGAAGLVFNTGTLGTLGVSGATTGSGLNLSIANTAGATFSGSVGTVGSPLGTVTLASTIASTGTVAFNGGLYTATLTAQAGAGAYNVSLSGGTVSGAASTTFANTGSLTIGLPGFTFTGGVTATAPSSTTLSGALVSAGGAVSLGPLTLGADASIDTSNAGASPAGAPIGVTTIVGGGYTLGLSAGTTGAITASGNADNISALTIASSNGTTFQGTYGSGTAGAVTISGTQGTKTVSFQGNTRITTLSTVNLGYNVALTGALNVVDTATTFLNTGSVTLGQGSGSTTTFTAGVVSTASASNPSGVSLYGALVTGGAAVSLGPLTLGANASIDTSNAGASPAGASIGITTITGNAHNLTLLSRNGTTTVSGAASGLAAVTLQDNTAQSTGAVSFTTGLAAASLSTFAQPYALSIAGASITSAGVTSILNTNGFTLSGTSSFSGGLSSISAGTNTLSGTVSSGGAATQNISLSNLSIGAAGLVFNTGTLGTLGVSGATTGSGLNLSIANTAGATFSGSVGTVGSPLGTVTLASTIASTGTVAFNGGLYTATLTAQAGAGAYNVSLSGGTVSGAASTTFANTGSLTIGLPGFTFTGGVTATAPSSTTLSGALVSAGGAVSLGPLTLGADASIDTSNAGASPAGASIGITTITGNAHNLTLLSRNGTTTVSGAASGLAAVTLQDNTAQSTGAVSFTTGLAAASLSTFAQPYALSIAGASITSAGVTSILNTNGFTLSGTSSFSGGLSSISAGTNTLSGTVSSGGAATQNISLSNLSIGAAGLVFNTGTLGTLGVSGATTGSGLNLSIANTAGATFSGSVGTVGSPLGTVTLASTIASTGTVAFNGGLYTATLTAQAGAGAYNVSLSGGMVSGAASTTFANTGSLTIGLPGFTFTGGVTATAPSSTTLSGALVSAGGAVSLGPLTLGADASIDTSNAGASPAGASIGITTITGNAHNLTLLSRNGTTTVSGAASGLAAVTLQDNTAQSTGAVSFTTGLAAASLSTFAQPYALSIAGASITSAGVTSILNTNGFTLSGTSSFSGGLSSISAGTNTLSGTVSSGGAATQNISLSNLSIGAAGLVFNTGTLGTLGVSGATTGSGLNLSIANTAGATFSGSVGTVGSPLGTVTLANTIASTGTVAFNGGLYTATLTAQAGAGAYNVSLSGGTVSGAASTTFANTGSLTIGLPGFTFTDGVTATAPSSTTLSGALVSAGGAVSLGPLTLGANASIDTSNAGASPAGASIGITTITGNAHNLTLLSRNGTTTVSGAASGLAAVTLQDNTAQSTGAVSFTTGLAAASLSTFAQPYALSIAGASITSAGVTSILNTNGFTLSGTSSFSGGLSSISAGTNTLSGTVSSGGAATQNISLSNLSIGAAGLVFNTGTLGTLGVSGATTGSGLNLSIANTAGATFSGSVGTVGSPLGTVTLASTIASTGTVAFNGGLYTATLTAQAGAGAYNVSLSGGTVSGAASTTFANTGSLTIGLPGFTFTDGVTATAPSATTLSGALVSAGGAVSLGPLTLGANASIDTSNAGASPAGAPIGVTTIVGGGYTLGLSAGTTGAITASGNADNISALTIASSNGTTFQGTYGSGTAGAVTISGTQGTKTVSFQGNTRITTLSTVNLGYNVALTGALNVVDTATTFLNTGSVTLGQGSGSTTTFTAGVVSTASASNPSGVSLYGALVTGGAAVSLGPLTLGANASIDTSNAGASPAGASIGITTITGNAHNLTLLSRNGTTTVSGAASGLAAVTLQDNTAQSTGAVSFTTGLAAASLSTFAQPYALSIAGASITSAGVTSILNTNGFTLSGTSSFSGGLSSISAGTNTLSGTVSSGGAATQNISLSNLSIGAAGLVFNTGTLGTLGVSGATTGSGLNLSIANTAGATFSGSVGTVGSPLGTVTLASTIASTGTVAFNGGLYTATLTAQAGAGAYNVSLSGGTVSGAASTTFANTGSLTIGLPGFTFTGGVTATAPSSTTLSGALVSAGGAVSLGPLTLGANASIDTSNAGASPAGASIGITTITGNAHNLTLLSRNGTTTVSGAASGLAAVTLQDNTAQSTGAVSFTTGLAAVSLSTFAQPYALSIAGASITSAGVTSILNTNGFTLSGTSSFSGGLSSISAGTNTLSGTVSSGGAATQNISLSNLSIGAAGLVFNTGTLGTLGVSGATTGSGLNLSIANTAGATFSGSVGTVGSPLGTVTLASTIASTGTVAFNGGLYTATLTAQAGAGAYNVSLSGGTVSGAASTTFANTGSLTIGLPGFTFTGGVTATAPSGTTLSGALVSAGGAVSLGPLTLGANASIDTSNAGASPAGAPIGVTTIVGGGYTLGLSAGTTGAITASGNADNISALTIASSNGTTFQGTYGSGTAGAVTISGTQGTKTVSFQGNTRITTLSTVNLGYNVALTGALNVVDTATTFLNTGSVTLGQGSGSTTTFTAGVVSTASASNPSGVSLYGALVTGGAAVSLGPLTLGANASIDTSNAGASPAGASIGITTITGNAHNLTLLSRNGTTTVSGAASGLAAVTLQDNTAQSTGAVSFTTGLAAVSLSTFAQPYALSIAGASITSAGVTSILNTNGFTLSGTSSFSGGLSSISAGTNTLSGTVSSGGAATQNISLSNLSIGAAGLVFNTGTLGTLGVSGATTGSGLNLSIANTAGATFSGSVGTVGSPLGTVTLASTIASTGTVAFNGGLYTATLTAQAGAGAYNVSLSGGTVSGAASTTFANTGSLTIGLPGFTFTGGVTATAPSSTTLSGALVSAGGAVSLGPLTLGANASIDTSNAGASPAGAPIGVSTIVGGGYTLGLSAGTTGAITASGNADNISALTIASSNGTTFQGTYGSGTAGAVTISGTQGTKTVSFQGNTRITTLSTVNLGYNVALTGALNVVDTATTFLNTGSVTLGQGSGSTTTFTAGVVSTASASNPSGVSLYGALVTGGAAVSLGPLTLGANASINTTATTNVGKITLGAVTGAAHNLTLQTGAVAGADINATSTANIGTLTLQSMGGTATFTGQVNAASISVLNNAVNVAMTAATGTITGASGFANSGTLVLGQSGGTLAYEGGIATSTVGGTVTLNGTIDTTNAPANFGAATVALGSATTIGAGNGAVTLGGTVDGGYALVLSTSGAIGFGGTVGGITPLASLTITTGTASLNGHSLSVNGALSGTGTLTASASELISVGGDFTPSAFNASGSTVTLTGAAAANVTAGLTFYNLTVSKNTGVAAKLLGGTAVNNNVDIVTGTLDGNSQQITVAHNWSNTDTYTAGAAGTVVFVTAGTSTVAGNTAFQNFTCAESATGKTIQFTAGTTQIINGLLTITGAITEIINLVNFGAGSWTIVPNGTSSVVYALVRNSTVTGSNVITAVTSRDDGGNTIASPGPPGWNFTTTSVTWSATAPTTDWSSGPNWDRGYVPNTTDTVTIVPGPRQPVLTQNTTVVSLAVNAGATVGTGTYNLTLTGDLTVSGAGARLNATNTETITVSGNVSFSGGAVFAPASSTVNLQGGATTLAAPPAQAPFNNLTISKITAGASLTLSSAVTVNGTLAVSTGTILVNGQTLTVGTNTDLNSANGTIHLNAASSALALGTNTLTLSAGTLQQDAGATIAVSAGSLTVSGGTYSAAGAGTLTLSPGGISVTSGSLALGNMTVSTAGLSQTNGTLTAGNSQITSAGNVALTAGTFTPGGSTLIMSGASPTLRVTPTRTLFDLTVNVTGTVAIVTDALTVTDNLLITAGSFSTAGNNLTVGVSPGATGTGNITAGAGANPKLVTTGSETVTVFGNIDFSAAGNNLTQAPTSTISLQGGLSTTLSAPQESFAGTLQISKDVLATTVQLTGTPVTVNGTLAVSTGTILVNGQTLTVGTNTDLNSANGTIHLNAASSALALGTNTLTLSAGTLQQDAGATIAVSAGSLTVSGGTYSAAGAGTLTLSPGGISVTSGSLALGNMTVSTAGLSQTNGTLTAGNSQITSAGNVALTAGTFTPGGSTLIMSGASPTLRVTPTRTLFDLTVNVTGTVAIVTDALTVTDNLLITAGSFSTAGNNLTVGVSPGATGTGNITAGAGTNPKLVTTGSETVTVFGNIDFSAAGNNLTQAPTSTISLQGGLSTTLSAPQESFAGTLQISKDVLATTVQLTGTPVTVNGTLAVSTGTILVNGQTLTVGTNTDLNSANGTIHLNAASSALALGTNTLTLSAGTLQQDAGATIAVSAGSLTVSGGTYSAAGAGTLTLSPGGISVTSGSLALGNMTVSTAGLSQTNGTLTAGNSQITSTGNVALTAGTFTPGGSTLIMSGASPTLRVTPTRTLFDLTVNVTGTVAIVTDALTVTDNLLITAGSFSTAGNNLTVGVSPGATGTGNITAGAGANPKLVTTGSETVTVFGNIDFSAAGNNLTQAPTSTISLQGGLSTTLSAPQESFAGTLQISKDVLATTVQLTAAATNVTGTLQVATGTLALNGETLTLHTSTTLGSPSGELHLDLAGSALSLPAAGSNALVVSAGALVHDRGAVTAGSLTVSGTGTYNASLVAAAGTITVSGLTTVGGAGSTAAVKLGQKSVSTAGFSQVAGTASTDAGSSQITSSDSVTITAGTFAEGTSLLTMTTDGTTVDVASPNKLHGLTIGAAGSGTVTIAGSDLALSGTLTVTANWTFGTSSRNLNVAGDVLVNAPGGVLNGSASAQIVVSGNTAVAGALNLNGGNYATNDLTISGTGSFIASSSETITVGGSLAMTGGTLDDTAAGTSATYTILVGANWSRTVGTNFNPRYGTVEFTGTGTISGLAGAETFYNLAKSGGATTTASSADLTIISSVTLSSGTLANIGTHRIFLGNGITPAFNPPTFVGVVWDSRGGGVFSPGTGSVNFINDHVVVYGDNTFYDFLAATTSHSITIYFQQQKTQTVTNTFNVVGTGDAMTNVPTLPVLLLSEASLHVAPYGFFSPSNTSPPPPPNDPNVHLGPPHFQEQWLLKVSGTSTIGWAEVQLSFAVTYAITPGPGSQDWHYNDNWFFVIPIMASWTLDTNNNGRIDRIRVQVQQGSQLSDQFGGLVVSVAGYTVTGYATAGGVKDDVFDILLAEGTKEDTSATPKWQLLANPGDPTSGTSLYGINGTAKVEFGTKTYTAEDGARPVITYALAALGSNRAYVHFSELVYGNATDTLPIGPASLLYSGGAVTVQPTEMTGNGAHAAIVTLPAPLASADILSAPQTIWASAGAIWGVAPADDPGTIATPNNTNLDNNLPSNATRSMLNPTTTPTAAAHNISDVGIGFAIPVFALDRDLIRDPASGGLGLVTVFDGSKWLPPQNTLIEARIMVPALAGATVRMFWDTNPPTASVFNNLWIPTSATTMWPAVPGGDRVHYPGYNGLVGALSPSSITGPLLDFLIPSSNPAIKDGATVQFLFTLDDGAGHVLPIAYQDPGNPAAVRPFEYALHSIIQQRGQVTITNNVINPGSGQVAYLHYVMPSSGAVTITVFTLGGDIVNVLTRGTQAAGEYTTSWDGKNRGGRIVARGIYFIRVVGPGFDEMRKVLVVR